MMRVFWPLLVLVITAGAAPHPSPSPPLPVPPIPPGQPPADRSAPMPDRDLQAPLDGASQGVKVSVQDFRIRRFYQGLGYTPGSHFETSEERKPIQTPGLTLQVPIQ